MTTRCFRWLIAFVVAGATMFAQVKLTREENRIRVEIDGKPFGDLVYGPDAAKPYFAPLRSASGKIVTRQFPMVEVPGESRDHKHHRGLWAGYKEVNGYNFWENEFSYNNKMAGKIVTRQIEEVKSGEREGTLRAVFQWIAPTGSPLLEEDRTMVFRKTSRLRMIDVDIVLKAVEAATFGDDKDGTFAVRVADALTERRGGLIVNSAGQRTMKKVWGKPANWVDYSGELEGEKVGIAIFDHPSSFHHPVRWHARDYGLLAANPFGAHAYDKNAPVSSVTLKPGETVHLRYLVVVHPAMDPSAIGRLYDRWSAQK
jgi:hypothetical protein